MVLFFYNLALLAGLVFGLPWWLWRMATTVKYREGIRGRLGRVPSGLRGDARPLIWLHAVSVGEVLAVSRLVSELETALPGYRLVISTTTRTGQALARDKFGSDRVFYCPLDLPWAVRAYLEALKPRMLILAETEFWPNLLNGCFKREIPVAVVNARISDRSWPRYRALRGLWKPLLSQLSLVLAQSELDAERLKAVGCTPDRVKVTGNLKFDVRVAFESQATNELKVRGAGLRFLVAGSTLEGEEKALLDAWPQLLAAHTNLTLVIAPRHPERFGAVASLLDASGHKWSRRSAWNSRPVQPLYPGQIVLLDTIGELASVYSLASVAFIGGSVVPAGGHNPLEPAQFGVPIAMGPYYENFRTIVDDLRDHNAIYMIADKVVLYSTLNHLLHNRPPTDTMGQRAREVFERQSGATTRSVEAICALLEKSA
jgi:3-deoxy-D-manno-octulosonic-acid transferase